MSEFRLLFLHTRMCQDQLIMADHGQHDII